jgi:hypothetical protein
VKNYDAGASCRLKTISFLTLSKAYKEEPVHFKKTNNKYQKSSKQKSYKTNLQTSSNNLKLAPQPIYF